MAGVGYGTWRHISGNTGLLSQGRWGILAYVTPIVLGAVLIILMLKPLLAAPAARQPSPGRRSTAWMRAPNGLAFAYLPSRPPQGH